MAILVKPIQRVNPQEPKAERKWYVTQVTTSQVDETQVAMDLADETTLNASEAMMAIRQLRKILLRRLLSGESVKFGNWGSFSVTLTSEGVTDKKLVNAKQIKNINLNFQPDEQFKSDLQKATFVWVDKLAGTTDTTDSSSSTSNSGGSSSSGGDSGSSSSGDDSGSIPGLDDNVGI